MTSHYFSNDLVVMHYFKFGLGQKSMFCFHGYGMHGRQFRILEKTMAEEYTFYGFDLFFHEKTVLRDQSVAALKIGISKVQLADLFKDFCKQTGVERFSIVAYSMGSHYATSLVEEMPEYIEELFVAAPSSLKPGRILNFLSRNPLGNKFLERMALSNKGMPRLLLTLKKLKIIDQKGYDILFNEIGSPELRFSLYACTSYMRFLILDRDKFISKLNQHQIRSVFIFGGRDLNYPAAIGRAFLRKINLSRQLTIDENHDMININFANTLSRLIHDH